MLIGNAISLGLFVAGLVIGLAWPRPQRKPWLRDARMIPSWSMWASGMDWRLRR